MNEYTENSIGSNVVSFFREMGRAFVETARETVAVGKEIIISKVTDYFRQTKVGKQIEETAKKKAIAEMVISPTFIIVILVFVVLTFLAVKGIKR